MPGKRNWIGRAWLLTCMSLFIPPALAQQIPGELMEINPPTNTDPGGMALIGCRLIDGVQDEPQDNMAVIVRGDRIIDVGAASEIVPPQDCLIVDLTGKSLLPGFVDTHFHSINDIHPPRTFLRHGVTAFRDPGHPFRFYQAVMQTKEIMPRVFLCGAHLDAYPPIWPQQAVLIDSPQKAKQAVHSHAAAGATAIKIYFRLPLEYYSAVCDAAADERIPVTAHLELVKARDAIPQGLAGIEHVTSFGTSLADPIAAEQFEQLVSARPQAREEARYRLWSKIDPTDSAEVQELISLIIQHDLVVSPTLAVFERRAGFPDAEQYEVLGFQNMLQFVGRCHQAGIPVVAGSHTYVPGADFGWAFQRELELLVESGMSPMEAIQAGTIQGARFLRADRRIGSIQPGKLADLVIVDGNPANDIKELRNIDRVMLAGQWVND